MDNNIRLLFDKDADVLYVTSGQIEYTDYEELLDDENVILRRDPKTQKIVGFTVIDFAARFAQKSPALSVPLQAKFERGTKERKIKAVAERKATYRTRRRQRN